MLWILFYNWSEISCLWEDNFKKSCYIPPKNFLSTCLFHSAGFKTCNRTDISESHWQYVSLGKTLELYFWLFILSDLIARCHSWIWHFCTEAHPPQLLNDQNRPIMENWKLWLFSLPLATPQVWYFWILVLHLYKFFLYQFPKLSERKKKK